MHRLSRYMAPASGQCKDSAIELRRYSPETCKEISKAGAHNQRAIVKAKISYNEDEHIWLEDLIDDIETCASSPLYSLLKREDEKFVTESAYDNPKFVEDIIRDVVLKFEENKIIKFYEVEIEAQESIHNHNAWAYQKSK